MESLNQTIKNTLHFIAVIQDVCDKKRLKIESRNFHEYGSFVKEWKNEQSTQCLKKPELVQTEKQPDEAAYLEEEIKELVLVDSLLEKARNIRLKNKSSLKKDETKQTPQEINNLKPSVVGSYRPKTSTLQKDQPSINKRSVPRSKSASISSKLKTSTVPRSKSANVQNVLNGNGILQTSKPVSKNGRTIQNEYMADDASNTVVLSSAKLSEFKHMRTGRNFCKLKSNGKVKNAEEQNTSSSDLKHCPEKQNSYPSYQSFFKEMHRTSTMKSSFPMQICGLWYPFLSTKSQRYLLNLPNIANFDSFTKAVKLIHQIQETMLWIDLLSLIGSAIPSLHKLDEGDWNVVRISSYFESIYKEDLQRTPVLDLN